MTSKDSSPIDVTWQVTSQRETTQIDPQGRVIDGVVVTFTTGTGAGGSVFIPADKYNPTQARGLIEAKARTVQAIADMSSGS